MPVYLIWHQPTWLFRAGAWHLFERVAGSSFHICHSLRIHKMSRFKEVVCALPAPTDSAASTVASTAAYPERPAFKVLRNASNCPSRNRCFCRSAGLMFSKRHMSRPTASVRFGAKANHRQTQIWGVAVARHIICVCTVLVESKKRHTHAMLS